MAYTIYNTDGTILLTLADNSVDSVATSLHLIGKNVNNYGQYFNDNMVKLLTSFASSAENQPQAAKTGQLWFDTDEDRLKVYNGSEFVPTYGSSVGSSPPVGPGDGDFWFDDNNNQLRVWDANEARYKLVGPQISSRYGTFGITTGTSVIRDFNNIPQKVGVISSYGNVIGFLSTVTFTMSTASSVAYLGSRGITTARTVINGLTVIDDIYILGNINLEGRLLQPMYSLSATYNITPFGDFTTAVTATNEAVIMSANIAIRNDLMKIFPPDLYNGGIYFQNGVSQGSEARVLCTYNTTTSVRRFRLENDIVHNLPLWTPTNLYTSTYIATLTNIVI
jgi:hypothetical protein